MNRITVGEIRLDEGRYKWVRPTIGAPSYTLLDDRHEPAARYARRLRGWRWRQPFKLTLEFPTMDAASYADLLRLIGGQYPRRYDLEPAKRYGRNLHRWRSNRIFSAYADRVRLDRLAGFDGLYWVDRYQYAATPWLPPGVVVGFSR